MRDRQALVVMLAIALCCGPQLGQMEARADSEGVPSAATREGTSAEERVAEGNETAVRRRAKANRRRVKARQIRKRQRLRATRRRARQQRQTREAKGRRANRPTGWAWPPTAEMKAGGLACKEELEELAVAFKRAPSSRGVATPIYVPSMRFGEMRLAPTFRKPPFVIDCHLARALRLVAPALVEAGVESLRFSSIYNYRHAIVDGVKKKSLSRHSYGLAVDVFEVQSVDGEILKVEDHYHDSDLLKRVEAVVNESGLFRLVLSPANDPKSHSDHLHFEADVNYVKPSPRSSKSR